MPVEMANQLTGRFEKIIKNTVVRDYFEGLIGHILIEENIAFFINLQQAHDSSNNGRQLYFHLYEFAVNNYLIRCLLEDSFINFNW
jgi:hypothetical protein